ncbi:tRNA dimethylallyltransferase-like isoform X2 [Babylonia areolata]|uniref:tRNA dimethylallyltransferase-like isoform X2 n=1 Tax=Babylonia areolata TaxID=304850 RepID=UPI003FD63823
MGTYMLMAAARRLPVVVVLGATGTGKSKLAIELGHRFNGEIISADSMQMYKGLDVITNKVTAEEQAQCPHHLLSVLNPLSSNNTVVNFKNLALPMMEKLLDDNKVPVIVGGTNYYIEALLWNFLIDKETADLAKDSSRAEKPAVCEGISHAAVDTKNIEDTPQQTTPKDDDSVCKDQPSPSPSQLRHDRKPKKLARMEGGVTEEPESASSEDEAVRSSDEKEGLSLKVGEKRSICNNSNSSSSQARQEKEGKYAGFDSAHLHGLLQKVDPESAKRLHPKNRRKVVRALQVYDDYGVAMSRIHRMQHSHGSTPGLSGALRYPHCCVFWLQTRQDVLDARLDGRVDDMLNNGLMSELHTLHSHYLDSIAAQNGEPDYTLGIFQSIGFKEFHEYLILPVDKRETTEGKEVFQKGVEALKLATRQYARRQLKWIKNRFLKRAGSHVPAVYSLDSTDPSQWSCDVLQPASDILTAVIQGSKVPVEPMSPDAVPGTVHVHNVCDVCDGRVFTTLQEWQAHQGSRKHKKRLQHKRHKEKAELQKQRPSEPVLDC